MIGYLKGKVMILNDQTIIIENNGIGYKVQIAEAGVLESQGIELFISTYMRENEIKLYGFTTKRQLQLFELLLEVNGVGPRAGLVLLRNLGDHVIIDAILNEKSDRLKIKGIGQKTAVKIVLELHNKVKNLNLHHNTMSDSSEVSYDSIEQDEFEDAKDALLNLGFKENEINMQINRIKSSSVEDMDTQQIIKYLLRELKKK